MACEIYSAPTFRGCTFANNTGYLQGGGVYGFASVAPTFENCTLYGNRASDGAGMYYWDHCLLKLHNTVIAFSVQSQAFSCDESCLPALDCCDLYGNAGGDWVGCIADQFGVDGNFSADPIFCPPYGVDFRVADRSPCLPENNPQCGLVGAWEQGCSYSGVAPATGEIAAARLLSPNPFAPDAVIRFAATGEQAAGTVRLSVYDAGGRSVRTLFHGPADPGEHQLSWNGTDDHGQPLPRGIYFYDLQAGDQRLTRRVVLVR